MPHPGDVVKLSVCCPFVNGGAPLALTEWAATIAEALRDGDIRRAARWAFALEREVQAGHVYYMSGR